MAFPIAARFAHPDGGYEGDQRLAAEHLTPGKVYVVSRLEVGRSSSSLFLDIPDGPTFGFNTVMFEPADADDVDGAIRWDDDDEAEDGAAGISTVGGLIDYLATQPRDRKVVLSSDAEGNGHSPLADAWEAMYAADTTYSGETYPTPEELAEKMAGPNPNGWSEEDAAPDDAERVIVLGPVN
jgi:hypothetical protein